MESTSKEAAVAALRAQNIAVSSILEQAQGLHVRWGRILFGLLILAGGTLMALVAKGTHVDCTRAGAAYDCTVDTTLAGFHTLYSETITKANAVSVEKRSAISGKHGRPASSRLIVATVSGRTSSSEWLQNAWPGSDHVAAQINQALAQQKDSVSVWQVEIVPMIVAAVLAITGLWLLARGTSH
jgi:hypothetical protein